MGELPDSTVPFVHLLGPRTKTNDEMARLLLADCRGLLFLRVLSCRARCF